MLGVVTYTSSASKHLYDTAFGLKCGGGSDGFRLAGFENYNPEGRASKRQELVFKFQRKHTTKAVPAPVRYGTQWPSTYKKTQIMVHGCFSKLGRSIFWVSL